MAFFILIAALIVGVLIIVAPMVIGLLIALLAVGIITASAAVGLLRRSVMSGVKTLFILISCVLCLPIGIGSALLAGLICHSDWSIGFQILVGAALGLAFGIGVAVAFNFIWSRIVAWIIREIERNKQANRVYTVV